MIWFILGVAALVWATYHYGRDDNRQPVALDDFNTPPASGRERRRYQREWNRISRELADIDSESE